MNPLLLGGSMYGRIAVLPVNIKRLGDKPKIPAAGHVPKEKVHILIDLLAGFKPQMIPLDRIAPEQLCTRGPAKLGI